MVLLDPLAQVEEGSGVSGVRASYSPAQPGNHLLGRRLGGVGTPVVMWDRRSC